MRFLEIAYLSVLMCVVTASDTCKSNTPTKMIFAIDGSGSLDSLRLGTGNGTFYKQLDYIIKVIDSVDILDFGFVGFGYSTLDKAHVLLNPLTGALWSSKSEAKEMIMRMIYPSLVQCGQYNCPGVRTYPNTQKSDQSDMWFDDSRDILQQRYELSHAGCYLNGGLQIKSGCSGSTPIETTLKKLKSLVSAAGTQSENFVMVLTDGESSQPNFADDAAALHLVDDANGKATTYAIGFGKYSVSELQTIATDDKHVFYGTDIDDLILHASTLSQKICNEVESTPVDCYGVWESSPICPSCGLNINFATTEVYRIVYPAENGGTNCDIVDGTTRAGTQCVVNKPCSTTANPNVISSTNAGNTPATTQATKKIDETSTSTNPTGPISSQETTSKQNEGSTTITGVPVTDEQGNTVTDQNGQIVTVAPSNNLNSASGPPMDGGAVAGLVIGLLALLALVAILVYFFVVKKNTKKNSDADDQGEIDLEEDNGDTVLSLAGGQRNGNVANPMNGGVHGNEETVSRF